MATINLTKTVKPHEILCDGQVKITLGFSAEADISNNPADIVLVLDRSGSMESALEQLQFGANTFIELIRQSSGGTADTLGSPNQIGIVSFSDEATQDVPLTSSIPLLTAAIQALQTGGSTNHADGFTKAGELFDPLSTNRKIIVMFTDGNTTVGTAEDVIQVTNMLKNEEGIEIYSIGLRTSGGAGTGLDVTALTEWASEPKDEHVATTNNPDGILDVFTAIAESIIGFEMLTGIEIVDTINSDFNILGVTNNSGYGSVQTTGSQVTWTIPEFDPESADTPSIEITIQHIGQTGGTGIDVNADLSYTDDQGSDVEYPLATLIDVIGCSDLIVTEPCPTPVLATIGSCEDSGVLVVNNATLQSQGRILEVDVTVKNVCPHKRVALAILVTELDEQDVEYKRGMKVFTVPAHSEATCQDVLVRSVKFALPEDLDKSGCPTSICDTRRFNVQTIAHHIDYDYDCCDRLS